MCQHETISSTCSGEIVDLNILQSNWLRAFWPISGTRFFPIQDLCKNTANSINFYYRTNTFSVSYICASMQKNQFIPSIHSWDQVNFRVPWPDWPHPLLTMLITDLFRIYHWFKNSAIWLTGNILAHISATKLFPNMGFVQEQSKQYKFSL